MLILSQLANQLGAELVGASSDPKITGVASIRRATQETVVFADDADALRAAIVSPAAAVLISPQLAREANSAGKALMVCEQPRLAFAQAAKLLVQKRGVPSIHPTAVISPSARLAEDASVGAYAVIGDQARIGEGSIIGSGAVVGRGVVVGNACQIYPRVVLYPGTTLGDRVIVHAGAVLGSDGFGYVRDRRTGKYFQFPQQGELFIEDDVEIGANSTIDRGALEETRIGAGSKIDNLVHLGHNVRVGRDVVIASQTGVSGSSVIGDNVIIGGQVGIGDHAFVGDGVMLGGQAGILPKKKLRGPGVLFWGTPAKPLRQYLKELATLTRLSRTSNDQPAAPTRVKHGHPEDE